MHSFLARHSAVVSLLSLLPLAAQNAGCGGLPLPDAVVVRGIITDGLVATATVAPKAPKVDVIPVGTLLGFARFEARIPGWATSWTGKSDVHGVINAIDTGTLFGNRAVFNHYTDVGGQGPFMRSAVMDNTVAQFTFDAAAGYQVKGKFRVSLSGKGRGTFTTSNSIAYPGGVLTATQATAVGTYIAVSGEVTLPQTVTITCDVNSTANMMSRTLTRVNAKAEFIPSEVSIPGPVGMGVWIPICTF